MTEAEYIAAAQACGLFASLLLQYDLPQILQDIEHADAFGCYEDPTLWIRGRDRMNEHRKMFEAALPFWRWAKGEQQRLQQMADCSAGRAAANPPGLCQDGRSYGSFRDGTVPASRGNSRETE